ncbi:Insulinase (Peptidase M16) [Mortierella claussenii]|nr:Insulinase (Peptidase M16) [Mortierella claussenii]
MVVKPLPEGFEMSGDGTHAVFTRPIETSPMDERSYRLLRLNNELEVLLIHDSKADKSAAALDVHVGHLTDPDNLQGLAHFLEHLLFMGTAKYPRENEYKEYLSLHSGSSNASTFLDNTSFHFEVGHEHLEGALDRFAQFFISPAFDESCKDREIRAVDSEFKRNLQMDGRRLFQLGKHLSSRGHPYWHFGTGNLITLQDIPREEGVDSRKELMRFYHQYYSANIMKLVILGHEPLDVLTDWALDKFSNVKNLGISPSVYPNPPLTTKELLTVVYVKPIKDTRSLEIKLLVPDSTQHYTVQPIEYIKHLIGHEGGGSILSLLKKHGWANSVWADSAPGGIGFEFFKINVDLTREGLLHYEDITMIIFQYIYMLREEGVKSYIWDEIASLAATDFRFKEMKPAASYVKETARAMQNGYASEWILSGSDLVRASDPDLVMDYIKRLSLDNWRSQVVSQDVSIIPGGAFTETEPWYGTEYRVAKVPLAFLERLEELERHPKLHLPVPNEYIPENFETGKIPIPDPVMHPVLIKHTALARIWHKKDDIFWVPKVNLYFNLRSPLGGLSPSHAVKSKIYAKLVQDAFNEESYSARLAGLSYSLSSVADGLILQVKGYNDKAHLLLQKVIQAMRTLTVEADRFQRIKDIVERQLKNTSLDNPNVQANYYMGYLHQERMWTDQEMLDELPRITSEDIQHFYPELLDRLHIEALVHGNMDAAQAIRMGDIVEQGLAPEPLVPSELLLMRSILIPEGCWAVHQRDVADPSNLNSGVEYYIQASTTLDRTDQALVQIMGQIIKEPCFNQLRTVEQLGYIVQSGLRRGSGTLGLRIVVQSERDPIYVENRIENFLRTRIAELFESMTEEAFVTQVQSLIQKKLEKHKNLSQETVQYWNQILAGFYDFEEIQEDVKEMEKATLQMAREFFKRRISPNTAYGRKLSVHIRSLKLPPPPLSDEVKDYDDLELREGTVIVRDAVAFKAGLELSRAPYPVVDLLRYSRL